MLTLRLVCVLFVIASPAFAATTAPHALMLDPIGTGCVDGGGYDDPFPASKGVMAPPFCMFNPCDRALSRTELSRDIVGRDVETWEWDAYYSRYAEYCRADAVNREGASGPVTARDFWAPLLAGPLFAYLPGGSVGRDTLFDNPNGGGGGGGITFPVIGGVQGSGGSSGLFPGSGGSGGSNTPGGGSGGNTPGGSGGGPTRPPIPAGGTSSGGGSGTTPPGGGGFPGTDTPPPVIPLPLSGLLLLSALAGVVSLRRRTQA
ncbi:hypothetical protein SAMN05444339_11517 [Loktanella atrilutea]|uniref:VPLPA-CTERM protein sorting domain-containing protein n=1 Tax=Loktanella atrilutea TaxID=366533 RepID=A0A1M5EVJ4_LOKAT|nr:hypothetical protein [Loktanella atrilutea]SHF83199.1 hypothetical protein SAMN05444339_11517 [Loktanella atrilutea]